MSNKDILHCKPYNPLKHNLDESIKEAIAQADPDDLRLFNRTCPDREGDNMYYRPIYKCRHHPRAYEQQLRSWGYYFSQNSINRLLVILILLSALMTLTSFYLIYSHDLNP